MKREYHNISMKTFRRILILTILLVFIMTIPTFAFETSVFWENYSYTNDNVTWYCLDVKDNENGYESKKAIIYGCNNNAGTSLTFPSTVKDASNNSRTVIGVMSLSDAGGKNIEKFQYSSDKNYKLTELHFPDTIYSIGRDAFSDYAIVADNLSLTTGVNDFGLINLIDLPDNDNLNIGSNAFKMCGCNSGTGTTVQFGSNPVKIDYDAFCGCTGIKSITIPAGSDVSPDAFRNCSNMTSIVNAPGELYMDDCQSKLENIMFDPSIKTVVGINRWDDYYYPYLTTVTLPANCTEISERAFKCCKKLSTIKNLDWSKIKYVGDEAFYGCKNLKLKNVIWNQDSLEDQFRDSGLVSITLPASLNDLNKIRPDCFVGCSNLTAINVESGNNELSSEDGILYSRSFKSDNKSGTYKKTDKKILLKYPAGKNKKGKYTIPADVEMIGSYAFTDCQLAELHIPITVRDFYDHEVVTDLYIYDGYYVFDNIAKSLDVYVVKGSYADEFINMYYDNLKVKYENGPKASIKYNLNGGKNAAGNPKSFRTGNPITLKDPTKKNCRFDGWNVEIPYQPVNEELENGVVFTANWIKMTVATAKDSYLYTGKAVKPALTVKANGKKLKASNYSATWKKNKAIGKATVTVRGKGKYKGCVATTTFKINPAKVKKVEADSNNKKTADISWKEHAEAAKITGYQVQMATDKKFQKNLRKATVKAEKNSITIKKLKSQKTYYVRVRAIKKVGKNTYYGAWSTSEKVSIK